MGEEKKDLVKYYYKNFLEDGIYEKLKWYENYESSHQYLIKVAKNLADSNMDLKEVIKETDSSELENNNSKLDEEIEDVDDFFDFFWKERDNGVAGSSQHNFNEEVYEEKKFIKWNEEILEIVANNKDIQGKYKDIKDFFRNLKNNEKNEINQMPNFSINRFFAALLPGTVSTFGAEGKFNDLFEELDIKEEEKDNWFTKNMKLTEKLESKYKSLEEKILPKSKFKDDDYKFIRSIFPWYLWEIIHDPMDFKKEVVYYGIPGTGKTYQAQKKAEEKFRLWLLENDLESKDYQFEDYYQLVQFHPSFDYEDFIEGIRPGKIKDGKAPLQLKNGVFKEFCQRAAKWEIDYYHLLDELEELEQDFSEVKVSDLVKYKDKLKGEHWERLFARVKNETDKKMKDYIPPYFFVIDEINRAELSRVLGELMYCLEYRGYEGKVKTQYSYLVDSNNKDTQFYLEETEAGKENFFFIPHNLYLIGTMNTIDRSIESFDFALRRRFTWEEKEPDADILEGYLLKNKEMFAESENNDNEEDSLIEFKNIDKAVKGFEELNQEISEMSLLGREYRIGHTYLFELVDHLKQGKKFSEALEYIWQHNIKPLIEEYLRGIGRQGDLNDKLENLEKKFLQNDES